MNHTPLRVVLADDHAIVRTGFRRLLEQQGHVQVIGEADNGTTALQLAAELQPDVLVLDLSMRGIGGFEVIRRLAQRDSAPRVLVFSMHEDAALAERAIQLGARGYVTKSNGPEVLVGAVSEVAAGRLYLSPDIAQAIALYKLAGADDPLAVLTAREFEVFRLLVSGRSSAEIARLLHLSGKTVANYHTLIKQKLGVSSDVELVRLALRSGVAGTVGDPPDGAATAG